MAENAYDLLKKTYEKQQAAINAQEALQSQEKADREALAKKTLEAHNRGVYTTYKNAINPYGAVASQTNRPTGTSEYMKNAAYGTMLQGLGQNQANYASDIQNSNSLWAAYLAEKAGQQADIEADYANAIIAQQNADKELAARSSYSGGGTGSSNDDDDNSSGESKYQSAESLNKYMNTKYTGSTASEKGFGSDYKSGITVMRKVINGTAYIITYKNGKEVSRERA